MQVFFQTIAENRNMTAPRTTRTMPVVRFSVFGVALFANFAAILAQAV